MVALFLDMFFAILINDLGLVKALLCLLIPGMFDKILGTAKSIEIIIWPLAFNTKDQPARFRMMQSVTWFNINYIPFVRLCQTICTPLKPVVLLE